jgi:hypothetical protein
MTGDGETVTPLLPEPGVWTGMAQANVWEPLRWKHAKIHRGSRLRILRPHQEAGYTSAVVTVAPNSVSLLQSGGVHIRPHMGVKRTLSQAAHASVPLAAMSAESRRAHSVSRLASGVEGSAPSADSPGDFRP